jgi:putative hydrolase of HD superfamily
MLSETDPTLDVAKIIAMLLIHDIVEIAAGDAPIHGTYDAAALAWAEQAAAERIFGLLPPTQRDRFLSLWHEFEAAETADARFAKALDRLKPLLLSTLTGGGTSAESGVTEEQVPIRLVRPNLPIAQRRSPDARRP